MFAKAGDPVILLKDKLEPDEKMKATSLHRTKARKAHQAANLACGVLIPREVTRASEADREVKTDQYRLEKVALLKQQSGAKGNQVAINEIADVTIVRSIPLMPSDDVQREVQELREIDASPPHIRGRNAQFSSSRPSKNSYKSAIVTSTSAFTVLTSRGLRN